MWRLSAPRDTRSVEQRDKLEEYLTSLYRLGALTYDQLQRLEDLGNNLLPKVVEGMKKISLENGRFGDEVLTRIIHEAGKPKSLDGCASEIQGGGLNPLTPPDGI